MAGKIERDEITGTETTGHEWDGIKELNTPLPRWWVWTFLACVIWSIGYWIVYPAWPMISGYTAGTAGYSSRGAVLAELATSKEAQAAYMERIAAADLDAIADDPELHAFALAGGGSAYRLHCATCHGSGAEGAPGIPNLNDDDWLWGGTLNDIRTTIAYGVRADDPDTRFNEMPPFGDGMLTGKEIGDMADYVLGFTGGDTGNLDENVAVTYGDFCAACHGDAGEGVKELGGPRLNDAIWHYGASRAEIITQITAPRHGMMPAWAKKLDAVTIKKLALYVHSLGGGE